MYLPTPLAPAAEVPPLPDALIVLLTAMTPIGELRASIPLAITSMDMPWSHALGLSIVGNLVPVPFILYALRAVGARIEAQENVVGRLLRWRTARIQETWGPRVRRYGFFGIVLAVAIPLPLTGAWTGALVVWTLNEPVRRGLPAIAAGVAIAGIVVTSLTLAGVELIRLT